MPTTIVSIPGIHCEGCVKLITDVTREYAGVTGVQVDLESKRVTIDHADAFDLAQWKEEVESLNEAYKVQPIPS